MAQKKVDDDDVRYYKGARVVKQGRLESKHTQHTTAKIDMLFRFTSICVPRERVRPRRR